MRTSLAAIAGHLGRVVLAGGWVWLAAALLLLGATSNWLDAPLGGIRGYRVPIDGDVLRDQAADGTRSMVSFGLLCFVVAIVAVCSVIGQAPRLVRTHLGCAALVGVISFPVALLTRNILLLETLNAQGRDREAIRRFAQFVSGYSWNLPPLELAGTDTFADRAYTTFQFLGWGWWVTLAAAVVLILSGLRRSGRRGWTLTVTAWSVALVALVCVIAGPAVVAEYHFIQAQARYASGQYSEALADYERVLEWSPGLRENAALQYRRGAAEFWIAGATSPAARGFLAENLRRSGDLEKAVDLAGRDTLEQPGWSWLRRNLAEAYAELGVQDARQDNDQFATATARWLRAREIDDRLVRLNYYLAHGFYLLHGRDQNLAIGEATQLLSLVRDLAIRSDALALIGDSYFKAERDVEARASYQKALDVVPLFSRVNLQAQRGLLGL